MRPQEHRDRSWAATIGMPDGWGPGPWDDDGSSYSERVVQCGNLRPWDPNIRPAGSRIVSATVDPPDRGKVDRHAGPLYRRNDAQDVLKVACWCGRDIVRVHRQLIRACQTIPCDHAGCGPHSPPQQRRQPRRAPMPDPTPAATWADALTDHDVDEATVPILLDLVQGLVASGRQPDQAIEDLGRGVDHLRHQYRLERRAAAERGELI